MVLLLPVAIGFVLGLALGGRPGRLAELKLRSVSLLAVAFGLQVIAFPWSFLPWSTAEDVATALWLGTYALLALVAIRNRHVRGFGLLALGMLCNLTAIVANGGHMPALPNAMIDAGVAYDGVHLNSIGDPDPNLPWLVDRWGAPEWVPWANVYSIGDVLLAAGAIIVIVAGMGVRLPWLDRLPRPGRPGRAAKAPRPAD
jgi:hypothetical protein